MKKVITGWPIKSKPLNELPLNLIKNH